MKSLLLVVLVIPISMLSKAVEVDEILTDRHSFKMDMSVSYSNIKIKNDVLIPLQYQTRNGDFVTVPTFLGNTKSNQDYFNYAFSLKYGINSDFELFTLLNLYSFDMHIKNGEEYATKSNSGFKSWLLGTTYKIKSEDNTPSILVGGDVDIINRVVFSETQESNFYLKGYRLFATSYYTVDPLVFLLMASYRYNGMTKYEKNSINRGEQFTLSPQFYFAVNPYSSLNAGVKYSFIDKNEINGKIVSNSGSNIAYNFGVSYELNSKTILNINAEHSEQLDMTHDSLSMGFSYKF